MIVGSVIDVGCGTGENALYLSEHGHLVLGVDAAPTAIEKARAKARQRGSTARFLVQDALRLQHLAHDHPFDTAIDSGLFHVFSDEERPLFVASLAGILREGGTYFMLCFSDREPAGWGPRRVSQAEIREAFADGWRVNFIREGLMVGPEPIQAWVASITR